MQPPLHGRVFGIRCVRCGNGLDLPHDARLLHIDCPFCGQDNVLPPELVAARLRQYELDQRHYALQLQEQARLAAAHEKERSRKHSSQKLVIWLSGGAICFFGLVGSCLAIGYYANKDEAELKARATDPAQSGFALLSAQIAQMQATQGCQRILVQPKSQVNEPSTVSLDMNKGDHCVHVLALTGQQSNLAMQYTTHIALTKPLPPPAKALDYRLCAAESGTHTFKIEAAQAGVPFTTAALECPRTPAEGGSRATVDDNRKNGRERVQAMMDELLRAGCREVSHQPEVARGTQTITITSPDKAACYNLVAASFFSDVKLRADLRDPSGNSMPVPAPDSKLRVEYCAPKAGKYQLVLTPSTGDHFAYAGLDCDRFGPEGLKRLKSLKK